MNGDGFVYARSLHCSSVQNLFFVDDDDDDDFSGYSRTHNV